MTNSKLDLRSVLFNEKQGEYYPLFFQNPDFNLTEVNFNSYYFEESDVEKEILQGEHSFAYLRDNKLRSINARTVSGENIRNNEFLSRTCIEVNTDNIFKAGKYLSRVFRATKYGGFYSDVDIHINRSDRYSNKVTDGISLISVKLAKSLGWEKARAGKSAQFTLFYKGGLVKGHCVLSDKISHDVVLYGEQNIKREISFDSENCYIAIEPVKLGKSLRLDIQSLLNLWPMFGGEQYLKWAYRGIEKYKEDLFAGRLSDWLDDFDMISEEKYSQEKWVLRKAIYHKIDYTRFPGLLRSAWTMFRSSIMRYANDINGTPVFRIPVPEGKRAYLRVDLRNHDEHGNFTSKLSHDEVELDKYGNLWFSPDRLEEDLGILGGADLDDLLALIPVKDGKVIIYRNPNQIGEYIEKNLMLREVKIRHNNEKISDLTQKEISTIPDKAIISEVSNNSLLGSFLKNRTVTQRKIHHFTNINLLRTYSRVSKNSANIGIAANAEMILAAIRISNEALYKKLSSIYKWDLERIIDATVKEGADSKEDFEAISALYEYIIENKICIPASLKSRASEKHRGLISFDDNHPLYELLEAVEFLVNEADTEIMGRGTVSSGNRIPGRIDSLDIPISEIGISAIDSQLYGLGVNFLRKYNRQIAEMLKSINSIPQNERETVRIEGTKQIQEELLLRLSTFKTADRVELAKVFAYEIYKTDGSVHDSILWMSDTDDLRGTASDTIAMLCDLGFGYRITKKKERKKIIANVKSSMQVIRIWAKHEISIDQFTQIDMIQIEANRLNLNNKSFRLGDDTPMSDGLYKVKEVVPYKSRKSKSTSKNSILIYI